MSIVVPERLKDSIAHVFNGAVVGIQYLRPDQKKPTCWCIQLEDERQIKCQVYKDRETLNQAKEIFDLIKERIRLPQCIGFDDIYGYFEWIEGENWGFYDPLFERLKKFSHPEKINYLWLGIENIPANDKLEVPIRKLAKYQATIHNTKLSNDLVEKYSRYNERITKKDRIYKEFVTLLSYAKREVSEDNIKKLKSSMERALDNLHVEWIVDIRDFQRDNIIFQDQEPIIVDQGAWQILPFYEARLFRPLTYFCKTSERQLIYMDEYRKYRDVNSFVENKAFWLSVEIMRHYRSALVHKNIEIQEWAPARIAQLAERAILE